MKHSSLGVEHLELPYLVLDGHVMVVGAVMTGDALRDGLLGFGDLIGELQQKLQRRIPPVLGLTGLTGDRIRNGGEPQQTRFSQLSIRHGET